MGRFVDRRVLLSRCRPPPRLPRVRVRKTAGPFQRLCLQITRGNCGFVDSHSTQTPAQRLAVLTRLILAADLPT